MLHSAEKSLFLNAPKVLKGTLKFFCCFITLCNIFCHYLWFECCTLSFPVPPGYVFASRQWDESLFLLFLLSSLGSFVTKQHWNSILRWIFGNVLYNKDVKDITMARTILRRHKYVRRRNSRRARKISTAIKKWQLLPHIIFGVICTFVFYVLICAVAKCFDSTLGFPGEGWSLFKMATWNTRSLTFERLKYCESLNYDVLAITETWRKQSKYQSKSTRYTTSSPKIIQEGPRKGQVRFPDDRAAGVGILLSKRAQKKVTELCISRGNRI